MGDVLRPRHHTRPIGIKDPRWNITFPQIVAPRTNDDESLYGLLLRSDFANGWPPGASLQFSSTDPQWPYRHTVTSCHHLQFDVLANALGLRLSTVDSMTYHRELTALYSGTAAEHWTGLLGSVAPFQVCPQCISDDHLLPRTHLLPGLFYCPKHNLLLYRQCICGARLEAFQVMPFPRPPRSPVAPYVCRFCRLPWESLPHIVGSSERLGRDRHLFSWYETFLTRPTPKVLMRAMSLLDHQPPDVHQTNTGNWAQVARGLELKYPLWKRFPYYWLAGVCEYLVRDGYFPHCVAPENFETCRKRYVIWDAFMGRATVNVPISQLNEPCHCGDQTWREPLQQHYDSSTLSTKGYYLWRQSPSGLVLDVCTLPTQSGLGEEASVSGGSLRNKRNSHSIRHARKLS